MTVLKDLREELPPEQERDETFGLVKVGSTLFAIPSCSMLEAVSAPYCYDRLACSPQNVLGMFCLREKMVSVLDTHALLEQDHVNASARQVLILQRGDQEVGIEIDSIVSVIKIQSSRLVKIQSFDTGLKLLFPRAYFDSETSRIVGILDVDSLFHTSGGASLRAKHSMREGNGAALDGLQTQFALVKCGDLLFGFATDTIVAISAMPALEQPLPGNLDFLGVAKWRGHDLTVQALASITAIASARTGADTLLMVVELNGAQLGIPVDELVDLVKVDISIMHTFSQVGLVRPHLFVGSTGVGKGEHALLLDHVALFASDEVKGLHRGTLGRSEVAKIASDAHEKDKVSRSTCGFIVYRIGSAKFASRLSNVAEIAPCPSNIKRTGRVEGEGLATWRGSLIEVLDMPAIHGFSGERSNGCCMLVVRSERATRGLIVSALHALVGVGEPAKVSSMHDVHSGEKTPIVTLGVGSSRQTYKLVDLHQAAELSTSAPPIYIDAGEDQVDAREA